MDESVSPQEAPGTLQTVTAIILNKEGDKILLVRQKNKSQNVPGALGLPGGKIEFGESPKESLMRKIKEETGLIVTEENLSQFDENYFSRYMPRMKTGVLRHASMKVFASSSFEGDIKSSDKTEPVWIHLAALNRAKTMPNVKLAVKAYMDLLKK